MQERDTENMTTAPKILSITDAAADRIRFLVEQSEDPVLGLRVGVSNKGCSGKSYVYEFAREQKKMEEVVEDKGVKVFVDVAAIMFLIGSEMDYVEGKMESRFVFTNPNETARCGCGESFSV